MREYKEAQRCLSRSESTCASAHLRRTVEIDWVRLRIKRSGTAMRKGTSVQRSMPIPKPSSRSSIWAAGY
jgi:hypothetical protein